jgi:hypothetical protein
MGDCGRSPRFGVIVNADARGYEETSALVQRADEEGLDLVGVPDGRDGYARSECLGAFGLRGTCRRVGAARHVPLLPAVPVTADDFGRRALLEQQHLNVPEFALATPSPATRKDRSFDTIADTTQSATRRNSGQLSARKSAYLSRLCNIRQPLETGVGGLWL